VAKKKRTEEIEVLIERIKESDDYADQLVFAKKYPARNARRAPVHPPLPGPLAENLRVLGVAGLYTHQAEAVRRVRAGENIVLATDTASGKSLCYNIPVLETLISNPLARAFYIFPTKALGQDQTRMLHELIDPQAEFDERRSVYSLKMSGNKIRFGTYDGDTPRDDRSALRREGNILLTNPDMLSLGILPNHSRLWGKFFERLKYVVLDEIHIYRGVFGSHVANLMRRLVRICRYYGSEPQFICCSATTGNPAEHAERITSMPMHAITESGAPSAGRLFVLWNPPMLDKGSFQTRRSPITESINLFAAFVEKEMRTIVFARAKPTVEVILKFTREKLLGGPGSPDRIVSYRGGYLPSERREIERALALGELLGVTCTNALELGVDIGSLDIALLNGYPGSIASVWQQAGRAGRRERQALAVMIAYPEPLDQYFMRHPEYFFGQPVEQAIVHPQNPYIMEMHLKAAAAELPLKKSESEMFGENYIGIVKDLIRAGELKESSRGVYYDGDDYPASKINLRTTTSGRYAICMPGGEQIGYMDASTAIQYLHDGAVYLHMGENFFVEKLDLKDKVATVSPKAMGYYTRSLSKENVSVDSIEREKKIGMTPVYFGYVEVTSRVYAFKKIRQRDNTVMGREDLDYPEDRLWTQGFWFVLQYDTELKVRERGLDLMGGLHAVEHAAIAMLPFLAMCDRQDIGGLSTDSHPDTDGRPAVFIHDAYDGGMGLAETGYERVSELLEKTLELVEGCECEDGCPSCIQSPKCGSMNEPLDKAAAILILKEIIGKRKRKSGKKSV
jgi:DEAD/DEAH box helicase domain-containing protein